MWACKETLECGRERYPRTHRHSRPKGMENAHSDVGELAKAGMRNTRQRHSQGLLACTPQWIAEREVKAKQRNSSYKTRKKQQEAANSSTPTRATRRAPASNHVFSWRILLAHISCAQRLRHTVFEPSAARVPEQREPTQSQAHLIFI